MKKLFALLLAVLLVFSLVACNNSKVNDDDKQNNEQTDKGNNKLDGVLGNKGDKNDSTDKEDNNSIIGIWVNEDEGIAYEFTKKGTCIMTELTMGIEIVCQYDVDGDTIVLTYEGEEMELEYSFKGNKLQLSDGEETLAMTKVADLDDYIGNEEDDENEYAGAIDEDLLGEWVSVESDSDYIEFFDDNTCVVGAEDEEVDAEWYVDGDELVLILFETEIPCEYEVSGDEFTLIMDGDTMVFEKN